MTLDCEVELYPTGRVSIKKFANMKFTKDILTKVIIKKYQPMWFIYHKEIFQQIFQF